MCGRILALLLDRGKVGGGAGGVLSARWVQGQLLGHFTRVLWALLSTRSCPGPRPTVVGSGGRCWQCPSGPEHWRGFQTVCPGGFRAGVLDACWLWAVRECTPRGACLGAGRAAEMLCFPGKSSVSQLLMTNSAFPQTLVPAR